MYVVQYTTYNVRRTYYNVPRTFCISVCRVVRRAVRRPLYNVRGTAFNVKQTTLTHSYNVRRTYTYFYIDLADLIWLK